jgi:hypothetical protein
MVARSHFTRPASSPQLPRAPRLGLNVSQALDRMQAGERLYLQSRQGRPLWSLEYGQVVDPAAAAILLRNADVEAIDSGLFPGEPGQTWRIRI